MVTGPDITAMISLLIIGIVALIANNINVKKIKPQRKLINDWTEKRLDLRQTILSKFLAQTKDNMLSEEEAKELNKQSKELLDLSIYEKQAQNYKNLVNVVYFGIFAMIMNFAIMLDSYSLGGWTFYSFWILLLGPYFARLINNTVVEEYETASLYYLDNLSEVLVPGRYFPLPFIEEIQKISMRTQKITLPDITLTLPETTKNKSQQVFAKVSIPIRIHRYINAVMSIGETMDDITNFLGGAFQNFVPAALMDIIGEKEMGADDFLKAGNILSNALDKILEMRIGKFFFGVEFDQSAVTPSLAPTIITQRNEIVVEELKAQKAGYTRKEQFTLRMSDLDFVNAIREVKTPDGKTPAFNEDTINAILVMRTATTPLLKEFKGTLNITALEGLQKTLGSLLKSPESVKDNAKTIIEALGNLKPEEKEELIKAGKLFFGSDKK